jgi:drug/metabolite transporter (DMT)-like permease
MAVGVVMVKNILGQESFVWVVTMRLVGGVAGMLLILALRRQWAESLAVFRKPHPWSWTLSGCFLGGYAAMLLWLAGYKLIPAPEAAIYNEAQASFIVLFAWLILRETISLRKIAGLALTLAGVLTMLLT